MVSLIKQNIYHMWTSNLNKHNIPTTLYRCMTLMMLLSSFALGVKAEKYYVIYYEEGATRHYLAISEDGNSLTNETTLSPHCYWVADETLEVALGKNGENTSGTTNNTTNQNNRKTLRSLVYPTKYIYDSGSTQTTAKDGTPKGLALNTSSTARWLLDNENENTPVLYIWYYKHYVYYESSKWQYSSDRSNKSKLVKIQSRELLSQPTIYVTQNGNSYQVRISAEEGCNIYYTTNGNTPTTASTQFTTESFTASKGTTIKAFAVKEGQLSSIAELFLPEILTIELDDREDHSWTYYSGVDTSIDGGNYNSQYAGKLYSPYPRDVKITYEANGGAVSLSEPENEFVYYKTLECKTVGTGDAAKKTYPYTVISNPFSKRPTGKGFGGWQIVSGHNYIKRANGSIAEENAVLELDEEITFINLPQGSTSIVEIKFKATWVDINKKTELTTEGDYTYKITGGTYETNILVLKRGGTGTITINSPCTITMVEPDGSHDYRNDFTFTGNIVPFNNTPDDAEGNTKIEYAHWNPTNIDAKGRNFTIGRGMMMDGTEYLYGSNTSKAKVDQNLIIESGKFTYLEHFGAAPDKLIKQRIVFGCDYDRAKDNNTNLKFTNWMRIAYDDQLPTTEDSEICRVYSLSGSFVTDQAVSNAQATNSYYFNVRGTNRNIKGHRYLEILGGEWKNIAGGWGPTHDKDKPSFTFRMKGGRIIGSIYGGAQYDASSGMRTFIITGGTINGWVAGGSNGTQTGGGIMEGKSFIYVGGDAQINSNGSTTLINRAVGGNVFGAGCGYDAGSTSGQVTLGTNVVIADNAYVERGVYGGGSYGYTENTSNIYITGGTVGGNVGGVEASGNVKSYNSTIQGGVYGGACQNKGGNVNIFMTGGTVNGGLYGGSNASGVLSGNVNMTITGGTINASVYGGGYGRNTSVVDNAETQDVKEGNVNIKYIDGTLNGNLFGGGNEGIVEGNTNVTITGGSVTGNVYGGGNQAEVKGTTNVVIGRSNDQQNSSN